MIRPIVSARAIPLTRRALLGAGLAATAAPLLTAQAATPLLAFPVIGDWGRQGTHRQRAVAAAMGRSAAATASRFTLSLGDNFYEKGVSGIDDPQWQESFERIYDAPALRRPWYVVLGNHDYRGNVEAELAYRGSGRWHMPARYYVRHERLDDGTAVDFFHIDTSPFVTAYLFTKTRIDGQDSAAQLAWLDRALGASRATWKLVIGHHPVFTATGGRHDTAELVARLRPLLPRHGVQACFAGHIHNLQETRVDGVCYVTSGAGSELGPVHHLHRPGFAAEKHGFVQAMLDRSALMLRYVDLHGTVLRESVVRRV